jgi:ATP adenylyltransferase
VPDLERLWSPWRMDFIRRGSDADGCVLCDLPAAGEEQDEANHLLARGQVSFVLLNAFPYNPGHLMAAPYRHVGDYEELTADELAEMMKFAGRAIRGMREESGPHGFNLGMNLGQVAGAGIADHLHLHLVPRWGGDTNFMPVVGQTKVLPELLNETYRRLHPWLAQPGERPSGPPTGPR